VLDFLTHSANSSPVLGTDGFAAVGEIGMKNLALKLRRFMVSEDGPTAVEYAVMLALIVIVCLSAITTLGTNAKTTFTNIGSSLGS